MLSIYPVGTKTCGLFNVLKFVFVKKDETRVSLLPLGG